MDILGHTLEEISFEKAGIIKENIPLITAEDKENCLFVFKSVCEERSSDFLKIHPAKNVIIGDSIQYEYHHLIIQLNTLAIYQIKNSSLAIECALYLRELGYTISDENIRMGIYSTQWKGRFETISLNPHIIIDGAHNMHGIDALVESTRLCKKPLIIVFSALKDKETEKMIHALVDIGDEVIVTEFEFYRAATLETLSMNNRVTSIRNPYDAINYAIKQSAGGTCLITGSLYFISEVRQVLLPQILGR